MYKERTCIRSMKNYTNTWVTGSTNQKVSNLTAHTTSDTHKAATIRLRVDSAKAKGESTAMVSPIAACFSTLDETRAKIKRKFDVCYLMAKENIPFVKYPALLELETRHGVSLGLAYSTDFSAQSFTSYIALTLRAAFVDKLSTQSGFFSFSMDGTTDAGNLDELVVITYSFKH